MAATRRVVIRDRSEANSACHHRVRKGSLTISPLPRHAGARRLGGQPRTHLRTEDVMPRPRLTLGASLFLVLAGGAAVSVPREAHATIGGGLGLTGFSMFLYNV